MHITYIYTPRIFALITSDTASAAVVLLLFLISAKTSLCSIPHPRSKK